MTAAQPPLNRAQRRQAQKSQHAARPLPKHERQRRARVWQAELAAVREEPLSESDQERIQQAHWLALRQLTERADEHAPTLWATLAQHLNIALLLAEQGLGDEHQAAILAAHDAIVAARERALEGGTWQIQPSEVGIITTALNVHDAQIEIATRSELQQACKVLKDRQRQGEVR